MEYPPFEKEIENIRDLYKKARYEDDYNQYIKELITEFDFKLNKNLLTKIEKDFSDSTLSEQVTVNKNYLMIKDSTLVSIGNDDFDVAAFFGFLLSQPEYNNKILKNGLISKGATLFGNNLLLKRKSKELINFDKEFASLMDDYQNGIFIFKLQESEVWNKINIDSTKLREEYNNSKNQFKVEGKVNFNEIFSKSKEKIEEYYQMLKNGVEFDSVAAKYTERPGFKSKFGRHGFKNVNDSQLSKRAYSLEKDGNFSEIFANENGWSIVVLRNKTAPRIKTFEEALPELSSKFQETESKRLETNYVNGLNNLYKPEIFYDELKNAYKQEEK